MSQMMVPFAPLDSYLARSFPGDTSCYRRGRAIGYKDGSGYQKLKTRKQLVWHRADVFAVRLGVHPAIIWKDWYELTHREEVNE